MSKPEKHRESGRYVQGRWWPYDWNAPPCSCAKCIAEGEGALRAESSQVAARSHTPEDR